MNDPHLEFDFFMRRWQVRLFIAGFILPTLMAVVLGIIFRADEEAVGIGCAITAAAFFLTAILLQGWRSVIAEKTVKERRKQSRIAATAEAGH